MKTTLKVAGLASALVLLATATACSPEPKKEQTLVEAAGKVATPTPDDAQGKALLAEFEKVNARLAHERNIGRAKSTCSDILAGKDNDTVLRNAQIRYSGGDFEATAADTALIVEIVKTNGFCVAG